MRVIVTTTVVYAFEELAERAQQRAVQVVRQKLLADWWDEDDTREQTAAVTYGLANLLGNAAADEYGQTDFPGIDGVGLGDWSLEHPQDLVISGKLDRANAPRLPWVNGISHVELTSCQCGATMVGIHDGDSRCICHEPPPVPRHRRRAGGRTARLWDALLRLSRSLLVFRRNRRCEPDCPARVVAEVTDKHRAALLQTVRDALSSAWQIGKNWEEFKSGEAYAREHIARSDYEFTAEGELWQHASPGAHRLAGT